MKSDEVPVEGRKKAESEAYEEDLLKKQWP